ncbi:MAG: hypothetical protein ACRYGR_07870, partial [Janthinobacterium lividum]
MSFISTISKYTKATINIISGINNLASAGNSTINKLDSEFFTYTDIYRDELESCPYGRMETSPGLEIVSSMRLLDITITMNFSEVNRPIIAVLANLQLEKLQQHFLCFTQQGVHNHNAIQYWIYEKILVNQARDILDSITQPRSIETINLQIIHRDIQLWIARFEERHQCCINVINDRLLEDLTLGEKYNRFKDISLRDISKDVLKGSLEAVFIGKSIISNDNSDIERSITILDGNLATDESRKVLSAQSAKLNNENFDSTNCLGSLLYTNCNDITLIPRLCKLDISIRTNANYEKVITDHLMTPVGVILNPRGSSHIEIVINNKQYHYQGPLYRMLHWTKDIDKIKFNGPSTGHTSVLEWSNKSSEECYNEINDNISRKWHTILTPEQLRSCVNAIIDNEIIDGYDISVLPKVNYNELIDKISYILANKNATHINNT